MASRLIASAVLTAVLFLLSADLVYFDVGGSKIKVAYFLIAALWAFKPREMLDTLRHVVAKTPWFVLLPAIPLAISNATSADPRSSILWTLWLGFDVFTTITVYAFLKVQQFAPERIQQCIVWSLGLVALFGLVQFVSIYVFHHVIFEPQFHFEVYRINGVSGWPIFLNIFSFLLLPLVLLQDKWSLPARVILAVLIFVLVQSTAKTGWVLFFALGGLLLWRHRRLFVHRYLAFLLPVTVISLLIPTPSALDNAAALRGTDKLVRFSADLDLTNRFDSGTDRLLINELGLRVFLKHPWFGVGPKAYRTYIAERFDQELPGASKYDANNNPIFKNENIWLELLSENGALFTLVFVLILVWLLSVPGGAFASSLHLGAWIALVLYFCVSGMFSQTGLLTMVYAVLGIFLYAREVPNAAWQIPRALSAVPRRGLDEPSIHPSHY